MAKTAPAPFSDSFDMKPQFYHGSLTVICLAVIAIKSLNYASNVKRPVVHFPFTLYKCASLTITHIRKLFLEDNQTVIIPEIILDKN